MKATTKTTRNTDGEYRIRLFINGEYQAGADYFTDDKEDAILTAAAMAEKAGYSDKSTDFAKEEQREFEEQSGVESEQSIMERILQHFPDAETSNHESDLYILDDTGKIYAWLRKNYDFFCNVQRFRGAAGSDWAGKNCLDIPFAFDPWWNKRTAKPTKKTAFFERFSLEMTLDQARSASHPGPCNDDVETLLHDPEIRGQLFRIPENDLKAELAEYGAWTNEELNNTPENWARIVWIAAGNITEEHTENA